MQKRRGLKQSANSQNREHPELLQAAFGRK